MFYSKFQFSFFNEAIIKIFIYINDKKRNCCKNQHPRKNSQKRIINSFENVKKEELYFFENFEKEGNEKEIKNCEIYINDKIIDFSYYLTFIDIGEYIIKYKFKNIINSTHFMFFNCTSLLSLDLSNFITKNLTDMCYMFYNFNSLLSLDLSN